MGYFASVADLVVGVRNSRFAGHGKMKADERYRPACRVRISARRLAPRTRSAGEREPRPYPGKALGLRAWSRNFELLQSWSGDIASYENALYATGEIDGREGLRQTSTGPMIVCSCNILSDNDVRACLTPGPGCPRTPAQVYQCLGCSPECGRCARTLRSIISDALEGVAEALVCERGCCAASHMAEALAAASGD